MSQPPSRRAYEFVVCKFCLCGFICFIQKIEKVLETVSLLTTIMANVMLLVFEIVVVLRPITRLKERLHDLEQFDFSDWEG